MTGQVFVIAGPMFSGKTTLLLHELERYARGKRRVALVSKDTRFDGIRTHSGRPLYGGITHLDQLNLSWIEQGGYEVVGVDEFHFMKDALEFCIGMAKAGIIVVACGLLSDFRQQPFEGIHELIPHADRVRILRSTCADCGSLSGIYNVRTVKSEERILEGAEEAYKVVCRGCLPEDVSL
jgi:thymidine kinase